MPAPTLAQDWKSALRDLKPGWGPDGNEPPITDAALAAVDRFCVVPYSNGGVSLEVHRDGWDVVIEIGPDGRIDAAVALDESE